jgi:hypothetical protein
MPSLIKYVLFLAADLMIIGCLIHFTYSTLYGRTELEQFARRAYSSFRTRGDEIKVYSYYVVVFLSGGLALYGALLFLFSWMPHRWVTYSDDGDPTWNAEMFAFMGAVAGTLALMQGLLHAYAKILELHRAQPRHKKFEDLIKRELSQIDSMLRYPARARNFQMGDVSHRRLLEERDHQLRDTLPRLEHEIDEAETKFEIFRENAEVCRRLISTFRTAYGHATVA